MAKSLKELQLAFKAQYQTEETAKVEDNIKVDDNTKVEAVKMEVPEVLEAPKTPATSKVLEATKEPEVVEVPEIAKVQEVPKVPEVSEIPEIPGILEIPKAPVAPTTAQIDTNTVADIPEEKTDKGIDKKIDKREEKSEPKGKATIVSDTIFYIALIMMVVFAVLFSRGAFGEQAVGGYRFYEVLTTSMDSVYPRGSLILIKEVEAGELIVGDDITFTSDASNLITHRIEEIYENYEDSGRRAFITKGVDNAVADAQVVLADNVVGKVVRGFAGLGATLSWIGSNLWIVLLLFLSLMALSFFLRIFWNEHKKGRELSS